MLLKQTNKKKKPIRCNYGCRVTELGSGNSLFQSRYFYSSIQILTNYLVLLWRMQTGMPATSNALAMTLSNPRHIQVKSRLRKREYIHMS